MRPAHLHTFWSVSRSLNRRLQDVGQHFEIDHHSGAFFEYQNPQRCATVCDPSGFEFFSRAWQRHHPLPVAWFSSLTTRLRLGTIYCVCIVGSYSSKVATFPITKVAYLFSQKRTGIESFHYNPSTVLFDRKYISPMRYLRSNKCRCSSLRNYCAIDKLIHRTQQLLEEFFVQLGCWIFSFVLRYYVEQTFHVLIIPPCSSVELNAKFDLYLFHKHFWWCPSLAADNIFVVRADPCPA